MKRRTLFRSHWMNIFVSLILSIVDKLSAREFVPRCSKSSVNVPGTCSLRFTGSSLVKEEYEFGTGKTSSRTVLLPAKWKPLHLHKLPPSPLLQAFSQNFWTENAPSTVAQKVRTQNDCNTVLYMMAMEWETVQKIQKTCRNICPTKSSSCMERSPKYLLAEVQWLRDKFLNKLHNSYVSVD